MFGSVRDGEAANFDVTGQGCFLLKSEEPTAGEVPGDEAVDRAFVHDDRVDKFNFCPLLYEKAFAGNFTGNFSVASQNQVA